MSVRERRGADKDGGWKSLAGNKNVQTLKFTRLQSGSHSDSNVLLWRNSLVIRISLNESKERKRFMNVRRIWTKPLRFLKLFSLELQRLRLNQLVLVLSTAAFVLTDKVEVVSNGTESTCESVVRQTPPPPASPSGRSPAASSSSGSPSPGQDGQGTAAPAEPGPNATSNPEQGGTADPATDSLPTG